ncbi:unnamed protein product [Brassicogethes aeneus]|uniref:C2H2-type domain-containing protein n=1 Tax=Brassicogethes aeneus TaxID=1431903 RepID=A0A9P0BJK0_BRAAE|nr:unnamed protein product [Brassicogethes aeneus]
MEQIVVKKELEESEGDILMNYVDQEKPSTSGKTISIEQIYIKQEIKEELDYDEALFDKGYKINNSDVESEDFSCNIKKEERDSDVSEEDNKISSNDEDNEEKYENEAMLEAKIEVEYHGVKCDDSSGKEKLFKCDVCFKKYQTKRSLFYHKRCDHVYSKDQLEKFRCNICNYETTNKSSFKVHLKIHDRKKHLKCHFCQYTAVTLQSLNAHIVSRHKFENEGENKVQITSKVHQCTNCSYSTVYKSGYDNHVKVCLKLKNVKFYECQICQYKTILKGSLTMHIKTHNKIKELKCLFCHHQSNKKQHLDNHILIKHSNLLNESNKNIITSKIHYCQHCEYKTTTTNSLRLHLKNNH